MNDPPEERLDPTSAPVVVDDQEVTVEAAVDAAVTGTEAGSSSVPTLRAMAGPLLGVALVSLGIGFLLARNVGEEPTSAGLASRTVSTPPGPTVTSTTATARPATGSPAASTAPSATTGATAATSSTATPTAARPASTATSAGAGTTAATTATTRPGATTAATTTAATTTLVAGTTVVTAPALPTSTAAPTTTARATTTTARATTTTRPATTTTRPAPTTTKPAPTTTVAGTAYRNAVASAGPIAYWRLDEPSGGTAADLSGNGRNGTYTGAFAPGQAGALANGAGAAVRFDGAGGQVDVADSAALRLNGAFSIELWARLGSFQNTWPGLISKGPGRSPDSGYLVWYDSAGRVVFKRNNFQFPSTPGAMRTDRFSHLVFTYDGTTVTWYVDGQVSASSPATFPANTGADPLAIGRGDQPGAHTIDEVALYGTALSASTVAAHYDAGRT